MDEAGVFSAHDVAAVLRERLPGLTVKKLHKLLYYCQGHHLATFGRPLFGEAVSAWDMGPVVGELWFAERRGQAPAEPVRPDQAALNTIGYVLSRYGGLTGTDLEHLTHSETPWQRADAGRAPGTSARIERDWLREFFGGEGAAEASDPAPAAPAPEHRVSDWLAGAPGRSREPLHADSPEEIRSRLGRAA